MPTSVVRFNVPYSVSDVYKECTDPARPLGVDLDRARVSALREGRRSSAYKQMEQKMALISPGFVRKVTYDDGTWETSELVKMSTDSLLVWRELDAKGDFKMVGEEVDGGLSAPETSIALSPSPTGTAVEVSCSFGKMMLPSPWCCCSPFAPAVLGCIRPITMGQMWTKQSEPLSSLQPSQSKPRAQHTAPPDLLTRSPAQPHPQWPIVATSSRRMAR